MTRQTTTTQLPVCSVAQLEIETPDQAWLIRSLWKRNAAGLISGLPKTAKTWLGLDMAVSVASGTPCLTRFPVDQPGRALVYLAEDDLPMVRARVESIARHRGIGLQDLDLLVITCPSLRIDLDEDRRKLEATVEELRPRFLLLDPLVRLHHLDENRAAEMAPLMDFLRQLQRNFSMALALVHHMGKKNHALPGLAVRGSIDFYAFADSCLYLRPDRDKLLLNVQHRNAAAPEPVHLDLVTDSRGESPRLVVTQRPHEKEDAPLPSLTRDVLEHLERADRPVTRTSLRETLRVNNARLGDALRRLQIRGEVVRTKNGWARPDREKSANGTSATTRGPEHQLVLPAMD